MTSDEDFRKLAQQAKDAEARGELPYAGELYAKSGNMKLDYSRLIDSNNFPYIISAAHFYKKTNKRPEGTPDFVKAIDGVYAAQRFNDTAELAIASAKHKVDAINKRMGSIGAGLITGGGVGTAIAGPIGAIVGAVVGGLIGGIAERFSKHQHSASGTGGEDGQ